MININLLYIYSIFYLIFIYMNLQVHDFVINNKIKKKYICINHGGDNISPKITWNIVNGTKSYALILEDPDALMNGTFIHWYIPYIDNNILQINKLNYVFNLKNNLKNNYKKSNNKRNIKNIKLIQGKNTLGEIGYHGPCAPNKVDHNYTFFIYSLNGTLYEKLNNNILSIKDHFDFERILKNNNINILDKDSKSFQYSYMNYI
jgi:Raf kinase inhibitor-like YbhB/YbcL family protein